MFYEEDSGRWGRRGSLELEGRYYCFSISEWYSECE